MPTTEPAPDVRVQLDELVARSTTALETLDSFRVTATVTRIQRTNDGEPVEPSSSLTSTVTLLADRSMWAEPSTGGFASYDANTGTSRSAVSKPDGTVIYQRVEGWNENSTGEAILLGHSPMWNAPANQTALTIVDAEHDGRPAWHITASRPGFTQIAAKIDTETWIDTATGLVVRSIETQTGLDNNGNAAASQTTESTWTDLDTNAELPSEFPGQFPDGATIDVSGDPGAFQQSIDPSELVTAFGPSVWIPNIPGATVKSDTFWIDYDNNGNPIKQPGQAEGINFTIATGFVTSYVSIFPNPQQNTPDQSPPAGQLEHGALAGRPIFQATPNTYTVRIPADPHDPTSRAVEIAATHPRPNGAIELLESLQPAQP